ncbi:MAG TPA: AsmA family protein [Candidatus Binatia bacterium]|jgi:hypothetical protein
MESDSTSPPRSRAHGLLRFLTWTAWSLVATLVTLLLLVVGITLGWHHLVPYAATMISKSTGREFRIDGDTELRLFSWRPHLVLEKVSFANPPWSHQPKMLDVGRFRVSVALNRLLQGRYVIPRITVDDATIHLEQRADGTDNWTLWATKAVKPSSRSRVPQLRHLRVYKTHLTYTREGAPQSTTDLVLDKARGGLAKGTRLVGDGSYQHHPARVAIEAGSIDELNDPTHPYPLDMTLRAGSTSAHIVGHLTGAVDSGGLDVTMNIQGDSLADLFPLVGVSMPDSPPYKLTGKLEHEGKVWRFQSFEGRMGDSDLGGVLSVDTAPKRPKMTADLHSKLLDFDDLAGLIGAPPRTGPGQTASPEQKAEVQETEAQGRVLPDAPVDVPKLQAMDADAHLLATRVNAPNHVPVDKIDLHLILDNGTLRADPASFDVANGQVRMTASVHTDGRPLRADVDIEARELDAARILGPTPFTEHSGGKIGGEVKVEMQGGSLHQLASTANGRIQFALADAQVSHLLVALIGLDVQHVLGIALTGDEPLPVRCAAFDLAATNGKLQSKLAVIDTDKSNITMAVDLDLGTEQLDAEIMPHPRTVSLLSLRQNLHVGGRLAKLDYYPDPLKMGRAREAVQKIDFALAPIIGLLTPFDVPTQKKNNDNGCSAFLSEQSEQGLVQEAGAGEPPQRKAVVAHTARAAQAAAASGKPVTVSQRVAKKFEKRQSQHPHR